MKDRDPKDVDLKDRPKVVQLGMLISAAEKIAKIGYEIPSLAFLITGTWYRRESLYHEELYKVREETGDEPTQVEKDALLQKVTAEYEPYSPHNLTETLRYQFNRETKESRLDRPPFPLVDSTEYMEILEQMRIIGEVTQILLDKNPGVNHHSYFPRKKGGQWQVPM